MAIRREDLAPVPGGLVYRFPIETVHARRRRAERLRRTRTGAAGLVIVGAVLLAGGPGAIPDARPSGSSPEAVVVDAGDTLWGLAERYAPEGMDPRAWIDAVVELNALSGPLQAGERLRLPR